MLGRETDRKIVLSFMSMSCLLFGRAVTTIYLILPGPIRIESCTFWVNHKDKVLERERFF